MKLQKNLSQGLFILSVIAILVLGLVFTGVLYYILNIEHQKPKKFFSNGPVTTQPKSLILNVDQPDQDYLSYSSQVTISGTTGPSKEILISTDTDDFVTKSKDNGTFSTVLNLDEGLNRIKIVVFDSSGDNRSEERIIYYSKEKI